MDLWQIYELDAEWTNFYSQKEQVQKDLEELENYMKIS